MRKKVIILAITAIMSAIFMSGCGLKAECGLCGDEDFGEKRTILGEEIHICNDCIEEINQLVE